MRDVVKTEELDIPDGVDITVKSRVISVSGPRGKLTKNVRHVNMDIRLLMGKTNKVTLAVWQGGRKHVACLRTIRTLINNMVIGVTQVRTMFKVKYLRSHLSLQGFRYKMRAVYAHFPINCIIQNDGSMVEIRNFLGEKVGISWTPTNTLFTCRQIVRHVSMLNGVTISESKAQKDELILEGNDIDMVSQSGMLMSLLCKYEYS